MLIGRHRSCDIHLANRRISHEHAAIKVMRDGGAILRDARSRNGTYINGKRIEEPVTLLTGMQIYLGGHGMLIATDSAGEFPIEAYNIPQFCHFALELYGSQRLAEEHAGKSRKFLTNHASKWKKGGPGYAASSRSPTEPSRRDRSDAELSTTTHTGCRRHGHGLRGGRQDRPWSDSSGRDQDRARQIPRSRVAGAVLARDRYRDATEPSASESRDGSRRWETRDGDLYLVMERVHGASTSQLCELGPLSPAIVRRIAYDILQALAFLHRHKVIHRDVSASNILIDRNGRVLLTDFGLVKPLSGSHSDRFRGNPAYASPEQLRIQPLTSATDLFSLGAVFYRLFTGKRPFDEDHPGRWCKP